MTGRYLKRKIDKCRKSICKVPYICRRAVDCILVKRRDFTVISNNCWAGKVYQYFKMPYLSPTVGLYIFAKDYLKFISNLYYYMSLDMKFIDVEQSKYMDIIKERNQEHVPIGLLDDVEIIFLHYGSKEEAKAKWERRKQRINYDNIFIKFSNMNLCTEEDMEQFDRLPFVNKVLLNKRKKKKYSCEIYYDGDEITGGEFQDTNPFPGSVRLPVLLRKKSESYPLRGLM